MNTKLKKQKFNRSNAVLVRVRIKKARASMKDEFLSDEMCRKYGIDPGSARFTKDIFKMTEINRPITRVRAYVREHGMPWSAVADDEHGKKKQDAVWIFNGREVKELADVCREGKEEFERAVREKADNWEAELDDIRKRLGASFRAEDIPSRDEFVSQFRWETEITPVQDMESLLEDYRLQLPEEVANEQIERFKRDMGQKISNVVQDTTDRVAKEILGDAKDKGLLAGLEQYDPDPTDKRKGNTFRDSRLYGNMNDLRDFAHSVQEVFPDSEDLDSLVSRLDKFCDEILPEDPELVRTDDVVRKRVIQGLRGLLDPSKMPEDDETVEEKPDAPATGGFGQFV